MIKFIFYVGIGVLIGMYLIKRDLQTYCQTSKTSWMLEDSLCSEGNSGVTCLVAQRGSQQ